MCSCRQGRPLDRRPPMTAIIPQDDLARVSPPNHQVGVETSKADRHHGGLWREIGERYSVKWSGEACLIVKRKPQVTLTQHLLEITKQLFSTELAEQHVTDIDFPWRAWPLFTAWSLKSEVLAMSSNRHQTHLMHTTVLRSVKLGLWKFPIYQYNDIRINIKSPLKSSQSSSLLWGHVLSTVPHWQAFEDFETGFFFFFFLA